MKNSLRTLAFGALSLALLGRPVLAQTTAPAVGNPPPAAEPAIAPVSDGGYLLGRVYQVETVQGTSFTGTLVSMSLAALEFDTPEIGHVSLDRSQIRRAVLQEPATTTRPGYFDIGNGNRLFFAPTGRGLRKGEATLQDVNVYLVGINYGLTDNLSLGGYVSVVPGLNPNEQFLVVTPKLSYPIAANLHAGVGLLYVRVPDFSISNNGTRTSNGIGAGLGYGVITYGGADDNLTFGLGYGFVNNSVGSTPLLMAGGQKRVSRRISLISENYLLADSQAGMGGLYGVKINWRRTSLGLGALYAYAFGYNDNGYNGGANSGGGFSTYILPVYYDFTFRFGKGARQAAPRQ